MFKSLMLSALLITSVSASAGVEVSVGATDFGKRGDGIWHQKHYGEYSLSTRSPTLAIGYTDTFNGLRWRAGVQYLGKHSTRCHCLSSDAAYALYKEGNDIGWPDSQYRTKGNTYGVYFTILPEYKFDSGWTGFVELGIGYFGISNKVWVKNWYPATNREHTEWGDAQTLIVDNKRNWMVTPIVGFGIRHERTSIAITARQISTEGMWYSIANKTTFSFEIRHSF